MSLYPERQQQIDVAAAIGGQEMVVGSPELDPETGVDRNCLYLLDTAGNTAGRYVKRRLVPFGEYVPGADLIPQLEVLDTTGTHMEPGGWTQPLIDGGPRIGKLAAAICSESSYPEFVREQVARGGGLIVVSTDEAWFKGTAELPQHAAISAVRAVENDRYVVQAAATGISEIVDPTGRVIAQGPPDRAEIVCARVESRRTLTPYVRLGDWIVAICAVLALVALLPVERFRRAGVRPSSARELRAMEKPRTRVRAGLKQGR
jgi:apolipoprotein N-acyltransferase